MHTYNVWLVVRLIRNGRLVPVLIQIFPVTDYIRYVLSVLRAQILKLRLFLHSFVLFAGRYLVGGARKSPIVRNHVRYPIPETRHCRSHSIKVL
jgi:hypothetical protein